MEENTDQPEPEPEPEPPSRQITARKAKVFTFVFLICFIVFLVPTAVLAGFAANNEACLVLMVLFATADFFSLMFLILFLSLFPPLGHKEQRSR
jgi:hypothetical protein